MDDRALVYRGADQPDLSVINPESDVWQHIKVPSLAAWSMHGLIFHTDSSKILGIELANTLFIFEQRRQVDCRCWPTRVDPLQFIFWKMENVCGRATRTKFCSERWAVVVSSCAGCGCRCLQILSGSFRVGYLQKLTTLSDSVIFSWYGIDESKYSASRIAFSTCRHFIHRRQLPSGLHGR